MNKISVGESEKIVRVDEENKYSITLSDWVYFLESNAQSNLNLGIVIYAILVTIGFAFTNLYLDNLLSILFPIVIIILLIIFIVRSERNIDKAKLYQKLSQKIMLGEITDPKEVLNEYRKI